MRPSLPVDQDPQRMSGTPVFAGTRVPVQTLFDYLIDGFTIHEFLEQFPSVKRDQVIHTLADALARALEQITPGAYIEL